MSKYLETLPPYHFTREEFTLAVITAYPKLDEHIHEYQHANTDSFTFFRYEDEFYIIHRDSGTIINWYKHLGRTNTCNKPMTYNCLLEFLTLFKIEMYNVFKLNEPKESYYDGNLKEIPNPYIKF